jgi:hypothetical protein
LETPIGLRMDPQGDRALARLTVADKHSVTLKPICLHRRKNAKINLNRAGDFKRLHCARTRKPQSKRQLKGVPTRVAPQQQLSLHWGVNYCYG